MFLHLFVNIVKKIKGLSENVIYSQYIVYYTENYNNILYICSHFPTVPYFVSFYELLLHICKFCIIRQPNQFYSSNRAVCLFGNDYLRNIFIFAVFVVVVVAVNEHYDICVLLNGAGFTQIGEHRAVVRTLFNCTAELGKGNNRNA